MKNNKKQIIITILVSFLYIFVIAFLIVIHRNNPSEGKLINNVTKQVTEGKVAIAIEGYQKLVRLYPRSYKVHLKLGDLYLDIDERKKAKIEYYRATKFSPKLNYDAHFALANLYIIEKEYELAEDLVKGINTKYSKHLLQKKGDFYVSLAEGIKKDQLSEALRNLKMAHRYHELSEYKAIEKTKDLITEYSVELGEQLKKSRHKQEAINILNSSLKYQDAAITHLKLSEYLISRDNKASLKHIKESLELDKSKYHGEDQFNTLVLLGNSFKNEGDNLNSKYCYMLAKKAQPNEALKSVQYNDIIVNVVSTKFNEDFSGKNVTPGISFKIMNISKDKINYLKSKIVFYEGNKKISETVKEIASKDSPIKGDGITPQIVAFSPTSLNKDEINKEDYRVQIFLSKIYPDKWELYRNSHIITH